MTAVVLRGDAAHLPLPDESVHLIVTSPPYFSLRSYTDGGVHYEGQIGSEATPREYIDALLACTREWVRVLKPSGSIFVNLGDKYSQRVATRPSSHQDGLFPGRPELKKDWKRDRAAGLARMPYENIIDDDGNYIREKSLMLLPERYRIACTDQLGLIAREVIEWHKPNPLPESVKDRCSRAHEDVVHLVKQPRYYSALDEIREPHTGNTHARRADGQMSPKERATVSAGHRRGFLPEDRENPLGKIPGSVWTIQSQPLVMPPHLTDDEHFAAFPMELPRRIILGWSPPGICTVCDEGRRPVAAVASIADRKGRKQRIIDYSLDAAHGPDGRGGERWKQTVRITGYACACPDDSAPTRPAVVLDPFGGTGTSALVADVLGRVGVTVDRSAGYCRRARWRTTDPGERARALGVPKPPPVPEGQGSLFEEIA